jgi:hypothetical protein
MAAQATWVGDLPTTLEIENATPVVATHSDELPNGNSPALSVLALLYGTYSTWCG